MKSPLIASLITASLACHVSAEELKPAAWVPLPAVGSSPETGFQYGAYVMRIFPQQMADVPQNRLELLLQGTTSGQYQAYLWPNVFFDQGRWQVKATLGGKYWPSTYFGESNDSPEIGDKYADTALESAMTLNYKTSAHWAIGGRAFAEYHDIELLNETTSANLLVSTVQGSQGGNYNGVGVILQYNTRNNLDWPSEGQFAELQYDWYTEALGSDSNFTLLSAKAAHFQPIANDVIGFSASAAAASDNTPFTHLPRPAGDRTLRGANGQRWINNYAVGLQSEYRKILSNRWAMIGFVDTFQVADELSAFSLTDFHISTGLGVRFAMTPDRFNIRLDVGWVDAESVNFAISVGEAF